jgi:riboflavin kinase/FMN adenylyltransferase
MRVSRSLNDIDFSRAAWVSAGTFDGIHLGHRALLNRLMELARRDDAESVLITFDPHPQNVISVHGPRTALLTPTAEKLRILESFGLDAVVVLTFTDALSRLSPEAFMEELRRPFTMRGMVSGTTHGFGSGRRGDAALIEAVGRRKGFSVQIVPPVVVDGEIVSSTAIRSILAEGDVGKARRFLGRFYRVSGTVVKGKGTGTKLGFPTANIELEDEAKLVPRDGVYAVWVRHDSRTSPGTVNVGFCPTIGQECRSVEAHINGFSGDLRNRFITVEFVDRLRDERRFESAEALTGQIVKDIEAARQLLMNDFAASS